MSIDYTSAAYPNLVATQILDRTYKIFMTNKRIYQTTMYINGWGRRFYLDAAGRDINGCMRGVKAMMPIKIDIMMSGVTTVEK